MGWDVLVGGGCAAWGLGERMCSSYLAACCVRSAAARERKDHHFLSTACCAAPCALQVSLPKELDLGAFKTGQGQQEELYDLYAVVVHRNEKGDNSCAKGHYFSYVKVDKYCHRIDDCRVTKQVGA